MTSDEKKYVDGRGPNSNLALGNLVSSVPQDFILNRRSIEFCCNIADANIKATGKYHSDPSEALELAWQQYAETYASEPRGDRPFSAKELVQKDCVTYSAKGEIVAKPVPKPVEAKAAPQPSGSCSSGPRRAKVSDLF